MSTLSRPSSVGSCWFRLLPMLTALAIQKIPAKKLSVAALEAFRWVKFSVSTFRLAVLQITSAVSSSQLRCSCKTCPKIQNITKNRNFCKNLNKLTWNISHGFRPDDFAASRDAHLAAVIFCPWLQSLFNIIPSMNSKISLIHFQCLFFESKFCFSSGPWADDVKQNKNFPLLSFFGVFSSGVPIKRTHNDHYCILPILKHGILIFRQKLQVTKHAKCTP